MVMFRSKKETILFHKIIQDDWISAAGMHMKCGEGGSPLSPAPYHILIGKTRSLWNNPIRKTCRDTAEAGKQASAWF